MVSLFSILALTLSAQTLPDIGFSPQDCALANGVPTATLPCTVAYQDDTMPFKTLRYGFNGAVVKYDIPFVTGPVLVTLTFVEPNKTAAGQRVFTYQLNNQLPVRLDIFSQVGLKKQLDVSVPTVVVDGFVHLVFRPLVGNAVISGIRVDQLAYTLAQIKSVVLCPQTNNCITEGFIDLKRGDGTTTRVFSTPITFPFTPPSGPTN